MNWRFHQSLDDLRRNAPAAERNKDPILAVLARVLPAQGTVLEIGSGTGQHVAHFAKALPGLRWQPSDADMALHDSIAAWAAHERLSNVNTPIVFDIHQQPWPLVTADALVCINVIHVAPWSTTPALLQGAAKLLGVGAPAVLYGPFRREGVPTSPGNEKFDADLKAHDPTWGLRNVDDVAAVAAAAGLALVEVAEMPANNLMVVFRRSRETAPVTETARLRLRRLTLDDAPFIVKLVNDPAWLRYIGDRNVRSNDDARAYLAKGPLDLYARWGYGLYLVERQADGVPMGICGLVRRDGLDDPDLGFAFLPEFRAQGHALEAAAAVLAHARDAFGLRRILAITAPENRDSIRVLERAGLAFERMIELDGKAAVMLFATRP